MSPSALQSSFTPAKLVPELLVTDINTSLRFLRDLCGFKVVYDRLDEGFAYLATMARKSCWGSEGGGVAG
jgi:catechol 2,3-dioxygenase-like lactoylglutathione lyase family enzyme